jgi:hypothetical protein
MITFATVTVRVADSREIRQPRSVHFKIAWRRYLYYQFRHFIETTDWEKRYLYNHWIDKICVGGIVASMIYFIPMLMAIIQK